MSTWRKPSGSSRAGRRRFSVGLGGRGEDGEEVAFQKKTTPKTIRTRFFSIFFLLIAFTVYCQMMNLKDLKLRFSPKISQSFEMPLTFFQE